MTHQNESGEFQGLSRLHLSRLLPLGLSGKREPIDELIDRLREPDGAAWFSSTLSRGPLASCGPLEKLLAGGKATLSEIEGIKKRSDALLENPADRESFLGGMACYFFAIAAAIVHHGKLITSQKRDKLDPVLAKLARAAPEPWAGLLERVSPPIRSGEKPKC